MGMQLLHCPIMSKFVVNPENEKTTKQYIPREILRRVSTPQAYKFGKLDWAYHEAFEKEIGIKALPIPIR